MGEKGARATPGAGDAAERLVAELSSLGEVSHRPMFGGFGVFEGGTMFALVDPAGQAFLRTGDANRRRFEEAGSEKHGRMPYHGIPEAVGSDPEVLRVWAAESLAVARAAKKR